MSKIRDVFLGVAAGDAIGYRNEFDTYRKLTKNGTQRRGPGFPEEFIVSDDTQMTLHLSKALDGAHIAEHISGVYDVEDQILDEWRMWYDHPENVRAPGHTTMAACGMLADYYPWYDAIDLSSNTCGAVMRFAPVAFLSEKKWRSVAALQAASTHGGPTAIASSIVATALLRDVLDKSCSGELLERAIELTGDTSVIDTGLIVDHPFAGGDTDRIDRYVGMGMSKLNKVLVKALDALKNTSDPWGGDPSYDFPGWEAADALTCALLCVDMLPERPIEALQRATVTEGDSDSIAAIAGAFIGALFDDPWPADWVDRLEPRYRTWISDFDNHYTYWKED